MFVIISISSSAQNLFVSGFTSPPYGGDYIHEITPGGAISPFASELSSPNGIAFNSAGDLFVTEYPEAFTNYTSGSIYVFTPSGAQSTFASGLDAPFGLVFNSAGDLFVADAGNGNIYEFTPDGQRSTFASGLVQPTALAFNSAGDLFVAEYAPALIAAAYMNSRRADTKAPLRPD